MKLIYEDEFDHYSSNEWWTILKRFFKNHLQPKGDFKYDPFIYCDLTCSLLLRLELDGKNLPNFLLSFENETEKITFLWFTASRAWDVNSCSWRDNRVKLIINTTSEEFADLVRVILEITQ